jgi:V8-like Glu-specific endopeptidase
MTTRRIPVPPLSFLATLLTAVGLFGCTEAETELDDALELDGAIEATIVDRRAFEAAEVIDADQLETLDNGDGTWSYALPEGFDPTIRLQGNIVTWRYAGQARFSYEPTQGAERTWIATAEPPPTPDEQLSAMKRIDRLGRIWKVDAIDENAWNLARQPAAAEREEEFVADVIRPFEPEYEPGTPVTWKPVSWDHRDCDPDESNGVFTPNEGHFWDGDGRTFITSGHNARQKTAVKIAVDNRLVCTGVILRQDQVLTAAHCVSDDNNNPIAFNRVRVFRDDINASLGARDIDFPGTYGGGSGDGGGTDFGDDWAIVELTSTWAAAGFAAAQDMDISSATDTQLGNLTNVHNLAFPQFAPVCSPNASQFLVHNQEFEPIAAILDKRLRFKIDGTPGHSGSPIYFCPEGDDNVCDVGEQGFVIAVFAGYDTFYDRFVGPKSASFIDAAVAFMDD